MFRVGDTVRLTQAARDKYLGYFKDNDLDGYATFSGPMVIVSIDPFTQNCQFIYPDSHSRYAGAIFNWPSALLELAQPYTIEANACQCPINVLMLRGCACKGI